MMDENAPRQKTPAETLRAWADKTERNAPEDFAGVYVLILPDGTALSGLLIDSAPDITTFFAVVKSRIDDYIEKETQKQKGRGGW